MVEQLRVKNRLLRDLGVKQAPFVVLIGAVMPSVLAEISFVTNPQECKLLKRRPTGSTSPRRFRRGRAVSALAQDASQRLPTNKARGLWALGFGWLGRRKRV